MYTKRLFLIALAAAVISTAAGCCRKNQCRNEESNYAPTKDCYNDCNK